MSFVIKRNSRSTPRPRSGTNWFIMPGTTSTIAEVTVAFAYWDIYYGEWYVELDSVSSPGSRYMFDIHSFWEAVRGVNVSIVIKRNSRSTPRPKIGTMWLIMSGSSWTVDSVIVRDVEWDEDKWWVTLGSLWHEGNGYLYSVNRFWEAVCAYKKAYP
jgi:hypothetical protein